MTIPKILLPLFFLLTAISCAAQSQVEKYIVLNDGFSIRCYITHQTETHYIFRVAGFYKHIDSVEKSQVVNIADVRYLVDSIRYKLPIRKMNSIAPVSIDEATYLNYSLLDKTKKDKKKGLTKIYIGASVSGAGLVSSLAIYGLSNIIAAPNRNSFLYGMIPGISIGFPIIISGIHDMRIAKQQEKIRKMRFGSYTD